MEKKEKKEEVKKEEVKNTTTENKAQPMINTDAVKAKTNAVVDKVKGGFNYYKNNIKTDKRLIFGTLGVVAIVVLVIVLLVFVNPSKDVAVKYAEAMLDYDAKEIVKITHDDVIDYFEDESDEDYKDMLKNRFDSMEESEIKYKEYEIDSKYKKYDKDDVEDFAEDWDDLYGVDEKSVKAVRRYTIKFKVSKDGERETQKEKVLIAKIDGKWYFMGVDE